MPRLRLCTECGAIFEAKPWQVKYKRDKLCSTCTPPDPHHEREYRQARAKRMVLAGRKCEQCSSKRKLQCHHVNGNAEDHRIENLRILCLTCHQNETRRQLARQGRRFNPKLGVTTRSPKPTNRTPSRRRTKGRHTRLT